MSLPQPPHPPPPSGWQQAGPPPGERDNSFGLISIISGGASYLLVPVVGGILAIVYGIKAQHAERAGTANNGILGTIGLWLGVGNIVLSVLFVAVFIGLFVFVFSVIGFTGTLVQE